MSTSLCFNEVQFSPVSHDNQLWIRATELARALGYKRSDILTKLYSKNADEFTSDMTQLIEIVDNTEMVFPVKTRIFSLRGCHLIAMFARTPIAKSFRKWVLDVLDKVVEPQPTLPPAPAQLTKSTADDRKPLRLMVNAWAKTVNVHQTTLWPQVRAHFNLPRIDKLPVEWIPDAIAWVEGKISEGMQVHIQNQQKSSPSLPSAPAPSTSLTLESINERIDDLRVRTKAERLEILHDIMTCAFKMPGMGMLIFDLQVAVEAMLENITGSGTEASFKYENPCTFIRSICNVISNSGQIERWRA